MFSATDGVTHMSLLQKQRLLPRRERELLFRCSMRWFATFMFQAQELDHQQHCLCDKADWPWVYCHHHKSDCWDPRWIQWVQFCCVKCLQLCLGLASSGERTNPCTLCEAAPLQPANAVMKWKERQWDTASLSFPHSKCFTTLLHQLLHTPATFQPNNSSVPAWVVYFTISHFSCLSSSFIPLHRISSFPSGNRGSSWTFPVYFSLALSLIAFLLHVSLHITLLLFISLPCVTLPHLTLLCFYLTLTLLYLAFVPSWLEEHTGKHDPIPATAHSQLKSCMSHEESVVMWCPPAICHTFSKREYILLSPWILKITKCVWECNCHPSHFTVGFKAC